MDPYYGTGWTDPDNNEYPYGGEGLVEPEISEDALAAGIGQSIAQINGVLGLKGGLTDIFKSGDDVTRGITISLRSNNLVEITAKLITDTVQNTNELLKLIVSAVTHTLQQDFGMQTGRIDIDFAEQMTHQDFEEKYGKDRVLKG